MNKISRESLDYVKHHLNIKIYFLFQFSTKDKKSFFSNLLFFIIDFLQ